MIPTDRGIINAVSYDRRFLDLSWQWLNDPDVRKLARVSAFSKDDQIRFFESLPLRQDYRLWGTEFDGVPVGAFGLRHMKDRVSRILHLRRRPQLLEARNRQVDRGVRHLLGAGEWIAPALLPRRERQRCFPANVRKPWLRRHRDR